MDRKILRGSSPLARIPARWTATSRRAEPGSGALTPLTQQAGTTCEAPSKRVQSWSKPSQRPGKEGEMYIGGGVVLLILIILLIVWLF